MKLVEMKERFGGFCSAMQDKVVHSTTKKTYLYITVFVTGAVALSVEILGTRLLSPFYGSTIFVWSSLISVTLGFLAVGYVLGGRAADKYHSPVQLYLSLVAAGVVFFATLQYKKYIILFADNFGIQYGPLVAALLLYGLTFLFIGTVGPYAIRLITESADESGSASGRIFAFSTVGSLFGSIGAGFFLVPIMPVQHIFLLISGFLVVIGLVGIFLHTKFHSSEVFSDTYVIVVSTIVLIFLLLGFAGFFIKGTTFISMSLQSHGVFTATETVYADHSFYGLYEVIGLPRASDGKLCFLIDKTNQGCVNPRSTERNSGSRYALVYSFLETLPPDSNVLVLGAGAGQYFKYWNRDDIHFDIVDINPNSQEVFDQIGLELDPERQKMYHNDARTFLRQTDKKYDVIWNDLLGNAAPVTNMMSKEAFELVYSRLEDDGIMLNAAIGKTNGDDELVNNIMHTMGTVFSSVAVAPANRDHFFTYALLPARKHGEFDIAELNKLLEQEWQENDWGEVTHTFAYADNSGDIITDGYNRSEYMWANLIARNESIASFRMKFKRLTVEDFQ